MKRFIELLHYQFQQSSWRPAIIYHDRILTFGELEQTAEAIGAFLREQGLQKGDIVILYTPEKLPFLLIHLGIILCGGVSLPLNPDFTPGEMTYFLNDSGARFVFASEGQAAIINKIKPECPKLEAIFDPSLLKKLQITNNQKFLQGGKDRREGGEKVRTSKVRLKASKPLLQENSNASPDFRHFDAFTAGTVHLKKPSVGPKGLIGPPCHGGFMLYSSGTTGQPKGVLHTHANTAASLLALQKCWRFSRDDVLLNVLPLFHIHGLSFAAHLSLISGSSMIIEDRFHPVKTMEKIKDSTVFMGVPTFYYAFLNRREFKERAKEWTRTRLFTCGSAPIRPEVLNEIEEIIGKPLINRYGMTESHVITSLPLDGPYKRGSVGLPLAGVEIKLENHQPGTGSHDNELSLGDNEIKKSSVSSVTSVAKMNLMAATHREETVGEVMVKSANLFDHYWKKPGATQSAFDGDGFFKTGDLGYFDGDGYLFLVGRKNDLIITSGFNVYPPVVERVINEFPGIKESAVIGIPDPLKGEKVMAVIVPESGVNINIQQLKKHCREKLVHYQCPVYFETVEKLPRNTMGKVLKRELKELSVASLRSGG